MVHYPLLALNVYLIITTMLSCSAANLRNRHLRSSRFWKEVLLELRQIRAAAQEVLSRSGTHTLALATTLHFPSFPICGIESVSFSNILRSSVFRDRICLKLNERHPINRLALYL